MERSANWEDVLGNPGGGYTAADALRDVGCTPDSTVAEVAEAVEKFTRSVYSDPSDYADEAQAEAVARNLLREVE